MGVRKETQGAAGKTAGGAAPVVRQNRAPVRHPCREVLSGVSTGRLLAAGAGQYYSSREALRDKGMAPPAASKKGMKKGKNLTCIVKDIALCLASTLSTEKRRNEDLHAKPIYCRDQRP
jgi:hypothetical protein